MIAPSLSQARIIFNEVAAYFLKAPLKQMVVRHTEYPFPKIVLRNGTEIHGRGANSEKYIRGNRAHLVVCDEAAFFKEGVIASVIEPLFTVTGKEPDSALILISTPFGEGEFKDYFDEGMKAEDGFTRSFRYTSLSNPHADMRRLERIRERYGEESMVWRAEYMAEFSDAALAVFPTKDIKWATSQYPLDVDGNCVLPQEPIEGHRYMQGVDLANSTDYFVAAVFDVTHLPYTLVRMDRHQKRGYAYYKTLIRKNYEEYFKAKTTIDATSLGEAIVEDLADINPIGFKFTSSSKYDLIQHLVNHLSDNHVVFPPETDIMKEFQHYQYKVTLSNTLRMEARTGFHDDIVTAFALALHPISGGIHLGFFQSFSIEEALDLQ